MAEHTAVNRAGKPIAGSSPAPGATLDPGKLSCYHCFVRDSKDPDRQQKYTTWAVSEYRRKLKLKAIAYKGGACIKCGYSRCPAALQFHHTDADQKEFKISGAARSWDRIVRELDKTILICANCHFEVHHEESERSRILQEIEVRKLVPVRTPAPHGASRYSMGCRCPACRRGHAARLLEYKKQRRNRSMPT